MNCSGQLFECKTSIEIVTKERHFCNNPAQLLKAFVWATVCRPGSSAGVCVNTNCPAVARAFDCDGNLVYEMCLNVYGPHQRFEKETKCIFDKFNLPCRWEVVVLDPNYKVSCAAGVEYRCCTDCTRQFKTLEEQ